MKDIITIALSGEAGQGLQTVEDFLVKAIAQKYYVFSTKDVMSRVRGGNNSVEIRVGSRPVEAYAEMIDILYLLNNHSYNRLRDRLTPSGQVFSDPNHLNEDDYRALEKRHLPLMITETAAQAGSVLYANMVLFGHIAGMLDLDIAYCLDMIADKFHNKSDKIQEGNKNAFFLGHTEGTTFQSLHDLTEQATSDTRILTGTDAIGIGALAGGCNFIAAYPMSPATGVLIYLSQKSNEFEVFVEQAEDEIAAINMTIGAWYAGARALTTTSGGGFALMEEGISLSGITETPCVTHIAQRPGPGTGLPTRTAQEDLNLAVYAGHGEFHRIVLAPGNIKDCVLLTQKAFYLADKYQVPVFILSDQYLLESNYQYTPFDLSDHYLTPHITETTADYKRYALTSDGISPRGIPGYGDGLVKCDSDEHTEEGMITEDFNVRVEQNDKRLNRLPLILEAYEHPELIGPEDYETLIVGWGSTYGVLKEYIHHYSDNKTAFLYIKQPFPLHPDLAQYFNKATTVIDVENNATGQLASLLKLHLDINTHHRILKYNGVPFSIEDIINEMKEVN